MINLSTNITVANAISSLRRWQVLDVRDNANDTSPSLAVLVQVLGAGGVPYGNYWLYAFDSQASQCLTVNASPQSTQDQLVTVAQSLAGTPYTTLAALWNANTTGGGTRGNRLKAIEAALVTAGLVSSAFAGT